MLFNSAQFLVFLPVVAGIHFLLPAGLRWAWLLAASYAFYMAWEPGYALLLAFSTLVDYAVALALAARPPGPHKRWLLALSLTVNLGLLFVFKYYGFFRETLTAVLQSAGLPAPLPGPAWLLPVGISFYTFQTLSYTIDVYRGHLRPERHLGRFALYVAFFPQLVAGPIERAAHMLPQLSSFAGLRYADAVEGLRRILWGFFKKVVVADRLAVIVDTVYADPEAHGGPAIALATLAFAFQIYCDFSGYTDIALGTARLFGVRLMENFRQPYFSASLREFWTRWHISLSTWFRDYVYVPLGGNRAGARRWAVNILIVFLLSGLWHGAAWTYVLWGGIHGAGLLLERALPTLRIPHALRVAWTFLLVNLAWVFFRAASLGDALMLLRGLGYGWGQLLDAAAWRGGIERLGLYPSELLLVLGLTGVIVAADALNERGGFTRRFNAMPMPLRWGVYSAGLWAIFLWGVLRQQEFIYFQF